MESWSSGFPFMDATFPGERRTILTMYGFPRSCFSRRRWSVVWLFQSLDRAFHHVPGCCDASEEDILNHWEGLGYYSRAMNIRKAARIICREHGGIIRTRRRFCVPCGDRTVYGRSHRQYRLQASVPVVDANVERVLARLFDIDEPPKQARTAPQDSRSGRRAYARIPCAGIQPGHDGAWCFGLPAQKAPLFSLSRCSVLPGISSGHRSGAAVPRKAAGYIPIEVATGVLVHDGRIFIQKRPASGVWANLWEFPGGSVESGETPDQALLREYYEETEFRLADIQPITVIRHGYTKYRVSLHCFYCSLDGGESTPILHAAQEFRWVRRNSWTTLPFPPDTANSSQKYVRLRIFCSVCPVDIPRCRGELTE